MYGEWSREDKTPDGLFSINTLARTCDTSRATLLRMENEGLIKPTYINPDNSYRYYDYSSIADVVRVINYQQLGFSKKDIAKFYNNPLSFRDSLTSLKEHYEFVLRELEELTLRIDNTSEIRIRETEIAGGYYFEKEALTLYSPEHVRRLALSGIQDFVANEMVGTGLRAMNLYICDDNNKLGYFDHKEHRCKIIIPTQPSDNEHVVYHEGFKALSLVCRYNYYKSDILFRKLWEEAISRQLTPIGPIRLAGLPEVVFNSIPGGDNNTLRILLRVE